MSEVKLVVGGRNYTVACEDGQEQHIERLAGIIDSKLAGMGDNLSSMEAKNLLFAALILADELDEAKSSGGGQVSTPASAAPHVDPALAEGLEAIASRLEKTAEALERGAQST